MTPEECHAAAVRALTSEQWDAATGYALTGLLSMAIGAATAMTDPKLWYAQHAE